MPVTAPIREGRGSCRVPPPCPWQCVRDWPRCRGTGAGQTLRPQLDPGEDPSGNWSSTGSSTRCSCSRGSADALEMALAALEDRNPVSFQADRRPIRLMDLARFARCMVTAAILAAVGLVALAGARELGQSPGREVAVMRPWASPADRSGRPSGEPRIGDRSAGRRRPAGHAVGRAAWVRLASGLYAVSPTTVPLSLVVAVMIGYVLFRRRGLSLRDAGIRPLGACPAARQKGPARAPVRGRGR